MQTIGAASSICATQGRWGNQQDCRKPQQPPIRPTLGSAGAANQKTVLFFSQKRVAITGMIIISQHGDEYHNFDDNYLDESDGDDVTFQSNQEWELFSA